MKSQSDSLNERLDVQLQTRRGITLADELPIHTDSREDEEIDDLLEIAHYFRSSQSMHVDSAFARRLDRRVRAHAVQVQQKRAMQSWWRMLFLSPLRKQIVIAIMSICLVLGTGAIAFVAQAATPTNPLSLINNLVQDTRKALAPSQLDEAEQAQQVVRAHLNILKTFAGPTHEKEYSHELISLEQQLRLAAQAINTIDDGGDRRQADNELAALKQEVRSTLHSLLPMLNLSEQLATTDELNRQGDHVIQLKGAAISISTSSPSQATITITGESFQPGAQLFVNNQLLSSAGTLQNGVYIFTVDWDGAQNPATVSLLNPDDTLAQTSSITLSTDGASRQNGTDNDSGNSSNDGTNNNENSTHNDDHTSSGNSIGSGDNTNSSGSNTSNGDNTNSSGSNTSNGDSSNTTHAKNKSGNTNGQKDKSTPSQSHHQG